MTSGVPQGSVLGPILFKMFVNDIPSVVSSSTLLFADDTKMFHIVKNSDDHTVLQHDLNLLYEWSVRWQLKFNILKCKHIHFGPANNYGPYYMNSTAIDTVESHLGILFDNQLKFHSHTTNISNNWNTVIQYGGHHLYWIKGRLRGYSAELQNFCHILKTSHMKEIINITITILSSQTLQR